MGHLSFEDIERQFVKNFVISTRQDRANYELTSESKRGRFFSRLAHSYSSIFKVELMTKIPRLRAEQQFSEIMFMLKTHGAKTHCYIMSYAREFDRKVLPVEEGIYQCVNGSLEAILICSDKLAFFQAERVSGSPPRFLLKAN